MGLLWGGCFNSGSGLVRGAELIDPSGERYLWISTECVDGSVDLASVGFSQEIFLSEEGPLPLLTFVTQVERDQCQQVAVVRLAPSDSAAYRFSTMPALVLPAGASCAPSEPLGHMGELRLLGDRAEVLVRNSAYCRGLDARASYVRASRREFSGEEQAQRFVSIFNLRDADALAGLFADSAVLIEPFSATQDGSAKRHVGRAAIRAYFERAFAASSWSAMELTGLRADPERRGMVMEFRYMDSALAEPFSGRSLLVFGGRPIFLLEMQAVGPIVARTAETNARVTP